MRNSMANTGLLGPINIGDIVCLAYWDGKVLYTLTDITGTPGAPVNFAFQSPIIIQDGTADVNPAVSNAVIQFQVGGTTGEFTLTEVAPGAGGLSYSSSGAKAIANKSVVPIGLQAVQTTYQDWGPPTVFLAGATYTFRTPTTGPAPTNTSLTWTFAVPTSLAPVTPPGTVPPPSGIVFTTMEVAVIVMPLVYFSGCTGTNCGRSDTVSNALILSYCALIGSSGTGVCTGVPPFGWTTIGLAGQGRPFNYCPVGTMFCQPTCMGPCESSFDACTWTGTQLECEFSEASAFSGEWWKSWWFIGGLAVVAVLALIFVLILYRARSPQPLDNIVAD